jgi:hypothetical protein
MLLAQARLVGVAPFPDVTFPFAASEPAPRLMTVILGGGGVGKTSLLAAIASTRPAHTLPQTRPWAKPSVEGAPPAFAVTEWTLDDDDPARPHPLRVASPNAALDERDDETLLRRREQALFDRRAGEGGFVTVAISGARWFSRTAVMLSSPERNVLRYDPRAASTFDDATRADLARETKQVLSYASIAGALAALVQGEAQSADAQDQARPIAFDAAVREAVNTVIRLAGFRYIGVDPMSLEPLFEDEKGGRAAFDDLPTSVRHLVALAALPVRALAAAYPGRDPRHAQGVVLVDDVDLHQEPSVQRSLAAALREALPRVQWILTTASMPIALGCDASEVLALRRMPTSNRVELFEGTQAIVH